MVDVTSAEMVKTGPFKALAVGENPARYVKATKLDDVLSHA